MVATAAEVDGEGLSDDEILKRQTTTFYAALRALSSSDDQDAQ